MFGERFSRALAVTTVASLIMATAAFADTFAADADTTVANNQTLRTLGTVAPGATVVSDASFQLVCDGKNHVDPGQTVHLTFAPSGSTVPSGGSLSAGNASIGPVPATWPLDTTGTGSTNCPSPTPVLASSAPNPSVTLTAPTTPGTYDYTVKWSSSLTPSGAGDPQAVTGSDPTATYRLTVSAPSDTTAPVITPTVTGTLGNNLWYTSDVGLTWTVSDPESALTSTSGCGAVSITADQGSTTYTCSATSAGGTNSQAVSIKRDATAPSIDPANVTDPDWRNTDLSQTFTASDSGSGLANADDASFTLTASLQSADGTTPTVASRTVSDNAGNSRTASVSALIDKTNPFISGSDINNETWRNTSLSQGFTASDALSGLLDAADAGFTLIASANSTLDLSGNPVPTTVSKTVADRAGNSTTRTLSALIDTVAPEISGADVADTTWRNTPLNQSFTASDALSGLATSGDASFTLTATAQSVLFGGSVIPTVVSKTVSDRAGNSATRLLSAWIDTGAPTVNCDTAPSFKLNQPGAQVAATVSDSLSGALSATASANADTSSVGTNWVTVTGYDNAGNSGTASCSYTVGYNFEGLSAPVDRPTTMNVSKAGQAVPLKWRLTDYNGVGVTNLSAVVVNAGGLTCNSTLTTDTIEEYAGTSGLQNLGDGYYQFNWKTPTSYANSCKTLSIKMGTATSDAPVFSNLANFNFKK